VVEAMGFWLGTLIFAVIEVVGFLTVEAVLGRRYRQQERIYGKMKNTRYDVDNVHGELWCWLSSATMQDVVCPVLPGLPRRLLQQR